MEQFILDRDVVSNFDSGTGEMIKSRYEWKVVWRILSDEYRELEDIR
jgi:hypothetical protein